MTITAINVFIEVDGKQGLVFIEPDKVELFIGMLPAMQAEGQARRTAALVAAQHHQATATHADDPVRPLDKAQGSSERTDLVTTAPTLSEVERLARELDQRATLAMPPVEDSLSKAAASMLRSLQAENERLQARIAERDMPKLQRLTTLREVMADGTVRVTRVRKELEAKKPLQPDTLADKCEAWLQAGGATNIVDSFEAGYRAAEATASIPK